jgi:antitoxin component YwqK of YwqJK toxin-antitoxin module
MKKIIATMSLVIIGLVTFSQNNNTQQQIKYVTHAPDGTVALTITDDTINHRMSVQNADVFYKYQILDQKTSESVYTSNNDGRDCIIDTTNLTEGTYDLRLYTSDFVITTDLEILRLGEFYAILKESQSLVIND